MVLLTRSKFTMSPLDVNRIIIFLYVISSTYLAVTSTATAQEEYLSSPDECARSCRDNETSKTCYYEFTLELYTVLSEACSLCTPNNTGVLNNCACVFGDGIERSILTANRMMPGPSIQVCLGDNIVVDVKNQMPGMETTVHWHGLFQKGTQYYDGVPFLTQCPISEGTLFRYQFIAGNPGTHFWHSHSGLQKFDGLFGSLIIRQPPIHDPHANLHDYDLPAHVIIISDWIHQQATELFPGLLNRSPGQDPKSVLINGMGRYEDPKTGNSTNTPLAEFTITSAQKYRFRLINSFATTCPAQLTIEGHNLTVIGTDGEPIEPVIVNAIISYAGERYDYIINADQPTGAYWIQLRALRDCPGVQQLAILRYEGTSDEPSRNPPTYDEPLPIGVVLNPLDCISDTSANDVRVDDLRRAASIDEKILQEQPDLQLIYPIGFNAYEPEDIFRPKTYNSFLYIKEALTAYVDNISYQDPSSPLLSQIDDIPSNQLCINGTRPADCGTPCACTNIIDIPLNSTVEVIMFDPDPQFNSAHPMHFHGHTFNVIGMGILPNSTATNMSVKTVQNLDREGMLRRNYEQPLMKDTIQVPRGGYAIFRFVANNPGYWLLHCHFEYHLAIGMKIVFHTGDVSDLPPIPENFPTCGNYKPSITYDYHHN